MNKKQLHSELKKLGVEIPEKASNKELQKLLEKSQPVKHVITQEDLDANPELVKEGVKVGDEVELGPAVPSPEADKPEEQPKEVKPVLGKPGWLADVVWKSLSDVQKKAICEGKSLEDARKL